MQDSEVIFIILTATAVFTCIGVAVVLLLVLSMKQKNKFILEKQRAQIKYEEELNKSKIEMQDATLKHIGRELHDNLGQLLTVTKIQTGSLLKQYTEDKKISALDNTLSKCIEELRSLSKSLDSSRIENFGLYHEIKNEVSRLEKLEICAISFSFTGDDLIRKDKAIMLFRIIQEFLSNSIKYSMCKNLTISINHNKSEMNIVLKDDGKGFVIEQKTNGSGLNNIRNRMSLLQAGNIIFESAPAKGTSLSFTIPTAMS